MKRATLLINPRPSTIGLAKYSCPSKTFEYMASGTPVLMTHLPGLPDEYEPYLYFPESEDVDGFAAAIDRIMSKSDEELKSVGLRAAQFIKNEKNSELVMKKVMAFVND
jgi:glycosyltransferase involved in cell wall biosynthesis